MRNFSFFLNNNIGGGYITFKYRYRKQIIIGIIIFVILLFAIGITVYLCYSKEEKNEDVIVEKDRLKKKPETKKEYYKVDIKGRIVNPGIYEMEINSRVIDVINSAGGLTEDADTSVINLSKKISDEMVIIIYSKSEVEDFSKTKEIEKQVQKNCNKNEIYSIENDACITVNNNPTGKININTASIEELTNLPGIGESRAKDIIKYREENGNFKNIEDLKKVSGIGENTFDNIKENITAE